MHVLVIPVVEAQVRGEALEHGKQQGLQKQEDKEATNLLTFKAEPNDCG